MKKVFLDTNVILDYVLNREGADSAAQIIQYGQDGVLENCASLLTMANVAYVARKGRTKEELFMGLRKITELFQVLSMDESQLLASLDRVVPDFEDMLQYQCALAHGCEIIVTRNKKHFNFSSLQIMTPMEFLERGMSSREE